MTSITGIIEKQKLSQRGKPIKSYNNISSIKEDSANEYSYSNNHTERSLTPNNLVRTQQNKPIKRNQMSRNMSACFGTYIKGKASTYTALLDNKRKKGKAPNVAFNDKVNDFTELMHSPGHSSR
jgi:hypothetical protein